MSSLVVYLTLFYVTRSVVEAITVPENDPMVVDSSEVPNLSADIAKLSESSADSAEVPEPLADPPVTNWFPVKLFDVTDYGAVTGGGKDSSKAFLLAWKAACAHTESATLFIPEGTFLLGPVLISGPCSNKQSPNVEIRGTLIAQPDLDAFPDYNWIEFKNLNGIRVAGGNEVATLDAQGGVEAWKQSSCRELEKCENLVTSLRFTNISDGNVSNIALSNSKGFHVVLVMRKL